MNRLIIVACSIISVFLAIDSFGQSTPLRIIGISGKIDRDSTSENMEEVRLIIDFNINRPDLAERIFMVLNSSTNEADPFHALIPVVYKNEEYQLTYNNNFYPIKLQYSKLTFTFEKGELENIISVTLYAQDNKGKYTEKQVIATH